SNAAHRVDAARARGEQAARCGFGLRLVPEASPTRQQPRPFELMARFDQPAAGAERRLPLFGKMLAQETLFIDEARERKCGNLVGKRVPNSATAGLDPGERGFEEMQMRIGLKGARRVLAKAAGLVAHASLKVVQVDNPFLYGAGRRAGQGRERGEREQ